MRILKKKPNYPLQLKLYPLLDSTHLSAKSPYFQWFSNDLKPFPMDLASINTYRWQKTHLRYIDFNKKLWQNHLFNLLGTFDDITYMSQSAMQKGTTTKKLPNCKVCIIIGSRLVIYKTQLLFPISLSCKLYTSACADPPCFIQILLNYFI